MIAGTLVVLDVVAAGVVEDSALVDLSVVFVGSSHVDAMVEEVSLGC